MSAAFLKGEDLQNPRYTRGVAELCHALGAPERSTLKVRKAAYGKTVAPYVGRRSAVNVLTAMGFRQFYCERRQCSWSTQGELIALALAHVDGYRLALKAGRELWRDTKTEVAGRLEVVRVADRRVQTLWRWLPTRQSRND